MEGNNAEGGASFDAIVANKDLTALHNPELGYTQYVSHPDGTRTDSNIEILLSDEVRQKGLSLPALRALVAKERARITKDPFGETSIDPGLSSANRESVRDAKSRTVNRISQEAEARLGIPLVIKTNKAPENPNDEELRNLRSYSEDLVGQYLMMRELKQSMHQRFTPEQQAVVRVAEVYGVVHDGDTDQLFMEYVDGTKMQNSLPGQEIKRKSGVYESHHWFAKEEHRELIDAFPEMKTYLHTEPTDGKEYFSAYGLRRVLADSLGIEDQRTLDTTARNIIVTEVQGDDGSKRRQYVIIDQNPDDGKSVREM